MVRLGSAIPPSCSAASESKRGGQAQDWEQATQEPSHQSAFSLTAEVGNRVSGAGNRSRYTIPYSAVRRLWLLAAGALEFQFDLAIDGNGGLERGRARLPVRRGDDRRFCL